MKTIFFKEIPTLVSREKLPYAHKLVKRLFPSVQLPNFQIAGRLKRFVKKWQFLTKDQSILEIVKGYQIPFLSQPLQQLLPREIHLNLKEKSVVAEEIENLLRKVAIEKVHMKKVSAKSQFVSNFFLVKIRDGDKRPVINLKNLNPYIPYHHLKMESLQSLRDILKKGDFMCKLDLKDAYFCIPFAEELEKFMRFYRERDLYQFLCLCFGLASAHYIFKKLLKILIAFLRRIGT